MEEWIKENGEVNLELEEYEFAPTEKQIYLSIMIGPTKNMEGNRM